MRLYPVVEGYPDVGVSVVHGAVFVQHRACYMDPWLEWPRPLRGGSSYDTDRVDGEVLASDAISSKRTPAARRLELKGYWPNNLVMFGFALCDVKVGFRSGIWRWMPDAQPPAWTPLEGRRPCEENRLSSLASDMDNVLPTEDGSVLLVLRSPGTKRNEPLFWMMPQNAPFHRSRELQAALAPMWRREYARDPAIVREWKAEYVASELLFADGGFSVGKPGCPLQVAHVSKNGPVRVHALPLPAGIHSLFRSAIKFLHTDSAVYLWINPIGEDDAVFRYDEGVWSEVALPTPRLSHIEITNSGGLWAVEGEDMGHPHSVQGLWSYSSGWRRHPIPQDVSWISGGGRGAPVALANAGRVYRMTSDDHWDPIELIGVSEKDVTLLTAEVISSEDIWVVGRHNTRGSMLLRSIQTTPRMSCALKLH